MLSSSGTLRELKIKTGVAKRTGKEYQSYKAEAVKQQARIDTLIQKNADDADVRKQREVLEETHQMLPDTQRRLGTAVKDLESIIQDFLVGSEKDLMLTLCEHQKNNPDSSDIAELSEAKETLEGIESLQGIDGAYNLIDLNLSNNKIRTVSHLVSLFHLKRLNLSYNSIQSLMGFEDVHGPNFRLSYLDLRGNSISSFDELRYLSGINSLKDLVLRGDLAAQNNPICKKESYQAMARKTVPQIRSLDSSQPPYEDISLVEIEEYVPLIHDTSADGFLR
ncbi:hypothetical protein HDU97_003894 [Phlyctochytrium planicorne]|nr:hypothetical protein HDU97_003894 [Phlyctochytrium planicorne]